MMSKKQWFTGMLFYTLYLLLGAVLYFRSEHQLEQDARLTHRRERIEIFNLLHTHYTAEDDNSDIMRRLEQYCGRPVTNTTLEDDVADGPYKWNFFNSVLFAITVTTTVGYGNLSPTSDAGRMWMILYALIGIPFTGILLATLGEFFSIVILRIQERYKHENERIQTRLGFFGDVAIYICMGILVFILLPACVFVYMEQWSWGLAIYYAFVTVSTIGFGDYVASQQPELGHGEVIFTIYRIALVFWLIFGLGYYFMVLAYMTRAWRSKRILKLEHKLAKNFKETQAKVWQGVKDIGYLRRILNEVYLQRVKPVYRDDEESNDVYISTKRSSSLPDLASFIEHSGAWRRRANSVATTLRHASSDTDIDKIDKDATFKTAPPIQPVDLLQHVVDALGSNPYLDRTQGVDGFNERDILASEGWSVADDRPRAVSDIRIPIDEDSDVATELPDAQWTWSGVPTSRHIHDLMRARQKRRNTMFPETEVTKRARSKTQGLLERWHTCKTRHKAKSLGSLLLTSNNPRRGSLQPQGPPPVYTQLNYRTHTGGVVHEEATEVDSLLEDTSIGELLRALTTLHSRVPQTTQATKPPSLVNLFAPPLPTSRRFSMRRVSTPVAQRSLSSMTSQENAMSLTERRRFSIRPTPPPSYGTPPPIISPYLGRRRFSLRTSPSLQGGVRRSSLKPSGSSPSSSGRQFQPLRPRFMIGPYDKQNVPRSRHDTS